MRDSIPDSILEAVAALKNKEELQKTGQGTIDNPFQVTKARQLLEEVIRKFETNLIPPRGRRNLGLARMIVDAWPLRSELGALVIAAECAYNDF